MILVGFIRLATKRPLVSHLRGITTLEDDELTGEWVARKQFFPPKRSPMLPRDSFKDKVALVTGGGTGFGRGIAMMLSQLGAKVAIVSRNIDVLKNTADTISVKTGNKVMPIRCDVKSTENVRDAVSDCIDELGLPTVVINGAVENFVGSSLRLSHHDWASAIDVILKGTVNVTTDVGKRLISSKQGGSFLNFSTNFTASGSSFVVPGICAMSGIECLTRSLASEWCVHGLRFNCIQSGLFKAKGDTSRSDLDGRMFKKRMEKIPTGRCGEIEELANLACYVVSDYASWMTGNVIKLDGGEYNFAGGAFNELVESFEEEEWVVMENLKKNNHN